MRHTMTVPLQLLVRTNPPPEPWQEGDVYYNSEKHMVQVFNGTTWGGLKGTNADEVFVNPDYPMEEETEIWIDTDEQAIGGSGGGGGFTIVQPEPPPTDGLPEGTWWVDEDSNVPPYTGGGGSGGGHEIQDENVSLTPRPALNFIGLGVGAFDDPTNNSTIVSIPMQTLVQPNQPPTDGLPEGTWWIDEDSNVPLGGVTGHLVKDEGTPLPPRAALNFIGQGVVVTDDPDGNNTVIQVTGVSGHTIQDEGMTLSARSRLNFVGAGVTAYDDAANDRTIVAVPSGNGHSILDEGATMPARVGLNFIGPGVTVTDSSVDNRTNVYVTAQQGYAPDPSGQPDGKQLEVKNGAYIFVNRPFIYSTAPPTDPRDGDVWIERSI